MKATTKTSSLSSANLEALFDELSKIAEDQIHKLPTQPEGKPASKPLLNINPKLKKYLKSTGIIGAGAGVGYGLGTILEKAVEKFERSPMPDDKKLKILGALLGASTTGAYLGREWLAHERQKAIS